MPLLFTRGGLGEGNISQNVAGVLYRWQRSSKMDRYNFSDLQTLTRMHISVFVFCQCFSWKLLMFISVKSSPAVSDVRN